MDTLREYIEAYGNPLLGTIPEKTWDKLQITKESLDKLLTEPSKSVKTPLYHREISKGLYVPVLEEYIPYLQAMVQVRYTKLYSNSEAKERLEKIGYTVTSLGQLSNIFNRAQTKLGLANKPRIDKRRAEANKGKPKVMTKGLTKQLADARSVKRAKDQLRQSEKAKANANATFARLAKQKGKTMAEYKSSLDLPAELRDLPTLVTKGTSIVEPLVPEDLENDPRIPKDTKILYRPTDKQAEFHAAWETIVLYGGAAG